MTRPGCSETENVEEEAAERDPEVVNAFEDGGSTIESVEKGETSAVEFENDDESEANVARVYVPGNSVICPRSRVEEFRRDVATIPAGRFDVNLRFFAGESKRRAGLTSQGRVA